MLFSRVYLLVDTNVSEEHTAAIFRAEADGIILRNVGVYPTIHLLLQLDHHGYIYIYIYIDSRLLNAF